MIACSTKAEVQNYIDKLNLSDDEEQIFIFLMKHNSRQQISEKLNMSIRTIDRRIARIKSKMAEL